MDDWWRSVKGGGTEAPAPNTDQVQIEAQTSAPSGAAVAQPQADQPSQQSLGSSSLAIGQLPPLPEGAGASPTVLRPGQDSRSARQRVEDSFDPSQTLAAKMTVNQQGGGPDAGIFDWKPVDNGSNQFQQFSQALGAKLKGIGALDANGNPDPSKYLQQVYASTVASNMPPAPATTLLSQGLEGQAKFEEQANAFTAGLQKAKGLGQAAVLKAKGDLIDYAKQFGVDTVEQRKSEIPGGTLRDTSKRNETNALLANEKNIEFAADAIAKASQGGVPNVPQLMMAAPQVIRAYATTLNPGQQLNEGNLMEVSGQMYPEIAGPKLVAVAAALGRGLRNNDWSGFDTFANSIDATSPQALLQRMNTLVSESRKLNKISLGSYMTQAEKPKLTEESLGASLGMKSNVGTIKAPIDLSTGAEPAIGQYYIHKGKVMRRDR
jgi:hypothetical protein